jgi:hypothetical protein
MSDPASAVGSPVEAARPKAGVAVSVEVEEAELVAGSRGEGVPVVTAIFFILQNLIPDRVTISRQRRRGWTP